jgi:hypothetical protein
VILAAYCPNVLLALAVTPCSGRDRVESLRHVVSWLAALLLLALMMAASSVGAVTVEGLYDAEVEVPSQGTEHRDAGIRAAMAGVLVKLTGDRDIAERPEAQSLLGQAGRYVQQYRYRANPAAAAMPPGAALLLWVAFDAAALNRFVQDSGLPVWGRSRPYVIVWIAIEESGQRYLADPGTQPQIVQTVEQAAARRGLPVVLPLMDLEDQSRIQVAEVWGNFGDPITRASARYRANDILVGRVYPESGSGKWMGRWSLYEGGQAQHWETRADGLLTALTAGVDGAADSIAQRYAQVLTTGAEQVRLTVEGISTVAQYAKVLRYLESVESVSRVAVAGLENQQMAFYLQLRTSRDGLRRALALGDVVVPLEASIGVDPGSSRPSWSGASTPDLNYRVAP